MLAKVTLRVWFLSSIGANAPRVTSTLNLGGEGAVSDRKGLNISSIYSSSQDSPSVCGTAADLSAVCQPFVKNLGRWHSEKVAVLLAQSWQLVWASLSSSYFPASRALNLREEAIHIHLGQGNRSGCIGSFGFSHKSTSVCFFQGLWHLSFWFWESTRHNWEPFLLSPTTNAPLAVNIGQGVYDLVMNQQILEVLGWKILQKTSNVAWMGSDRRLPSQTRLLIRNCIGFWWILYSEN